MASMKKFFGLLIAFALAAFALPAAATYYYSLNMGPAVSPTIISMGPAVPLPGSQTTLTATFKNESPANLTFRSLSLTVPSGSGLKITSVSVPNGTPTVPPAGGSTTISVTNMTGVTKGNSIVVTLTVKTTTTQCTTITGLWSGQPWTGTNLNGSKFVKQNPALSHESTSLNPACFTITGAASPTAGGTVSCPTSPVAAGGSSTCTATVGNPGYSFTGFGSGCTATGPTCTVSSVTSNQTVTANYAQIQYPINGSTSAGGTITCNPVSVTYNGTSTCSVAVNPGFTFTGFNNCASTGATTCQVSNVHATVDVSGNYTQIPYTITGVASPVAGGSVNCPNSPVYYNGNSTCTATQGNSGYTFDSFTGSCTPTGLTCAFSGVQGNQTVTANYKIIVTGANSSGAGGSVSCTGPVALNGTSTCTATVLAGYTFGGFTGGGCTGTGLTCTTSAISAPTTVAGTFTENKLTVTGPASAGAGNQFNITVGLNGPDVTVTVDPGSTCTLTGPTTFPATGSSTTIPLTIAQTNPPTSQSCTLNITAPGYTGTTLTMNSVYAGVLDCQGANYDSSLGKGDPTFDPDLDHAYVNAPGWGLKRGQNTDQVTCVPVNYTFKVENNTASLTYDKAASGQSNAAFKYVVLWDPVLVDNITGATPGWLQTRPRVSWGIANPDTSDTSTDFIPALGCNDDGTTNAMTFEALSAVQLQALLPLIPNVAPYNTYNDGFNPQYKPGATAKVCVAQHGITYIFDSAGNRLGQQWNKFVDNADTVIRPK